ncbi:putative phosphoglycerate mutase [Thermosporothrix hazakensis]|jgi:probable phosphoglycerate mutase|uniref:Putative phosphoglycerate mutase n=1 Tax=Thermosporothrix hazakensis TaxID=644383 RepID=A0A326TZJ0_THEHA|nr:histidine phosphatase family protein [Thermosporothrix hazakensis]PZW18028.1 putative phosphoglycerate mutase [Thermosporothrix hazakensis]GCE50649.1 hypothetical protein KTH_55180 [Thermosporothrix hazakensis]
MKAPRSITRHGERQWNSERRLCGWQESPLTALGVCQVQWLGEALREVAFTAIDTSPSQRTRTTAELIGAHHACDILPQDALRDLCKGDWERKTREELQQREPEAFAPFWSNLHLYQPSNGSESFCQVPHGSSRGLVPNRRGVETRGRLTTAHQPRIYRGWQEMKGFYDAG